MHNLPFASVQACRVDNNYDNGVVTILDTVLINNVLYRVNNIPANAFSTFNGLVGVIFKTQLLADLNIGPNAFPDVHAKPNSFIRFENASSMKDLPPQMIALIPLFSIVEYGRQSFACFKEGSKILCFNNDFLKEEYVPVETLKKGHLVQTLLNGYLRVDMIGKREMVHPASKERIKDQLYVCSPEAYPELIEPLVITGCHSILIKDFVSKDQREKTIEVTGNTYVTDKKYRLPACVDDKTKVFEHAGKHTIYHVALENDDYYGNYGIWSNGLLVESCSKRYLKELSGMTLIEQNNQKN